MYLMVPKILRRSNVPREKEFDMGLLASPANDRHGDARLSMILGRTGAVNITISEIDHPEEDTTYGSDSVKSRWDLQIDKRGNLHLQREDFEPKETGDGKTEIWRSAGKTKLSTKDDEVITIQSQLKQMAKRGAFDAELTGGEMGNVLQAIGLMERRSHGRV